MKLVEFDHRPRVGRPPAKWHSLIEPGENAVTVGAQKCLRFEVTANGDEPLGVGRLGVELLGDRPEFDPFGHGFLASPSRRN
jgi:hypothetical protein